MEKIELSESRLGLRIAAAVFFLILGASALAFGISGLINGEKGWRVIEAYSSETTCSQDFILIYNLGSVDSVSKEKRAVIQLYTDAAKAGYELFDAEIEMENVHNLKYLSVHPNEQTEIDPELYAALEKYVESGDRSAYLAPAYSVYDNIFETAPEQSFNYDPAQNGDLAELFKKTAEYAKDPEKVDIKLYGGGKAELYASQDYLDFLEEWEITELFDFYWLKNAFIADLIADRFEEAGLTNCVISSRDGYTRCLDKTGESFDVTLYCSDGGELYPAAVMKYFGPKSVVSLNAYPVSSDASTRYITLDGAVRSRYLDISDGMNRTSLPELYGMSEKACCADIALSLAPIFVGESFSPESAEVLAEKDIATVRFDGERIVATGETPTFGFLYENGGKKFTLAE